MQYKTFDANEKGGGVKHVALNYVEKTNNNKKKHNKITTPKTPKTQDVYFRGGVLSSSTWFDQIVVIEVIVYVHIIGLISIYIKWVYGCNFALKKYATIYTFWTHT